jgi:pantothenate kinase-related protein Tda10
MTQGEFVRLSYRYYLSNAEQWTHTRFLGTIILNMLAKSPKTPSEILPLFTDELYKTDDDRAFEQQQIENLINSLPKA